MSTTLIVLGLLLSAVIGFFLGRMHGISHRSKELSEALEKKEDELNDLQGNVKEHFDETARLFSNLTEEYKGLYQHLAKGATELSGEEFQLKISPSNLAGVLDADLDNEQIHEGEFENPDKIEAQQPVDYARADQPIETETELPLTAEEVEEKSTNPMESAGLDMTEASGYTLEGSTQESEAEQEEQSEGQSKEQSGDDEVNKTTYATQETSQEHPPGQQSI